MKNTIKELTEGMQRLCAVANRIVAQDGRASRIEIDLLLEDLRRLYDVALRLNGDTQPEPEEGKWKVDSEDQMMAMMSTLAALGTQPVEEKEKKGAKKAPKPKPAPVPEPQPEPKHEPEPEPEPLPEPEPAPQPEPEPAPQPSMEELEQNGNSLMFDEIILDSAPEPEAAEQPEPAPEPEPEPEPAPEPQPEPKPEPVPEPEPAPEPHNPNPRQVSLLDYLNQPAGRTLGEKLGGVESGKWKVESDVMMEKKVSDLRTVININDKFSFMSELFKGNMKAYNDFIMHLNAIASRDEALAHVREVAAQYKWDDNSPAVQTFYKIFDKKF